MGDPKYPRKVWRKPKRPLNYELKMDELQTLGTFGLRTKRELWKAHTELSRVRQQARSLLALTEEARAEKEPILLKSLSRIGLVSENSSLDDVLNLKPTDLLARRLQTIVSKKLGFKTPYQARQAVIHGHIMVGDRKVDIPSYTVTVAEEDSVKFSPESKIPQMLEKTKAEAPKVEAPAEGEEATPAEGEEATPAEATPAEATPAEATPAEATPAEAPKAD
jgi:small subunit ribosomal protein S4